MEEGFILVIILTIVVLFIFELVRSSINRPSAVPIQNKYNTLDELKTALRKVQFEDCNIVLGIDFTKSNTENGHGGTNLHELSIDPSALNPYQVVIRACVGALEEFDEDRIIPTFAFGDIYTKGTTVAHLGDCYGVEDVLQKYTQFASNAVLSGPTNFAPIIRQATQLVEEKKCFHILIILCDGQVTSPGETMHAIRDACKVGLSIVIIGIGKGPWEDMQAYDDMSCGQEWDNVQFTLFDPNLTPEQLVVNALQEIPDQWKEIKKRKLI